MSQNFTVVNSDGKTPRKRNSVNPKIILIIASVAVVLLLLFFGMFSPFVTIPTGHTGVVTTFGKVENYTLDAGFHLKNPIQDVFLMNNQTQKATLEMQAFSSDIQQVDVKCSVNFSVDRATAQDLYKTVGPLYYDKVVDPRIQENVKAVFTRYNAEKLMQVRNQLSGQVKDLLEPEMKRYGIQIEAVTIEDVDFTDAFTEAVEAKQVAEQTKLKVETEQAQQVSTERSSAERQIIAANAQAQERAILAEADANVKRINADAAAYARKVEAETEAEANLKIAASVTEDLIKYRQIDAWDGKLPMFSGGNGATPLPVIDVPMP